MTTRINVGADVALPPMTFYEAFDRLIGGLLIAPVIHTGQWQAMDTSRSKAHGTHEITDLTVRYYVPTSIEALQEDIRPDLPWANEHFAERVSGIPYNPPPSADHWPWAVRGNEDHLRHAMSEDPGDDMPDLPRFDHTYPERYWPRRAPMFDAADVDGKADRYGIRFRYGDLSDVVSLLVRAPLTRQAYLPVWFPEDTGAVVGQRVPCTLGYHFLIRDSMLACWYYIRSCDILRHFRNDVYFTARLVQWMCEQLNSRQPQPIYPGQMTMVISSLHAFVADVPRLSRMLDESQVS